MLSSQETALGPFPQRHVLPLHASPEAMIYLANYFQTGSVQTRLQRRNAGTDPQQHSGFGPHYSTLQYSTGQKQLQETKWEEGQKEKCPE